MSSWKVGSEPSMGLVYLPTFTTPKPTFLEVCVVNNIVFSWPETFMFHGLGGSWGLMVPTQLP